MAESYAQRKIGMENELTAELAAADYQIEQAMARLALYRKQVQSTEQVLDLLLSSYRNATADFEEILRVRQELLDYKIAVAKAEAAFHTAAAKIDYLSGKSSDYGNKK